MMNMRYRYIYTYISIYILSYAPLRGSRAQRRLVRTRRSRRDRRDFLGRFAWDVLEFLKIGATPHEDRDVRVQKHIVFQAFQHKTFKNIRDFNDFQPDS